MQNPQLSSISNFIWNIADSVLRDHYVRGKYRDVILPMDRHPTPGCCSGSHEGCSPSREQSP